MAITHYKDNLSPSLADTIRIAGDPFDLTGSSVKLRMRAEGSSTLKVDAAATVISASTTTSGSHTLPTGTLTVASTSGFLDEGSLTLGGQLVDYTAKTATTFLGVTGGTGTIGNGTAVAQIGGVRYDWVSADVDTAGEYAAWWRVTLPSTKVQETPEFTVAIMEHAGLSRALCELEDVVYYAPGYRSDPSTDAVLEQLILAQSRKAHQRTGREFKAISPAVNTRRFDLAWWNVRERKVRIGDCATVSTVKIIDADQATELETVSSSNYVALPRVRQEWEPITGIMFPSTSAAAATLAVGSVVEVTGTWGFPAVPSDLREAIAQMVVVNYVNDSAAAGTAFADALRDVNIGGLFANSREIVDSYMLPQVA